MTSSTPWSFMFPVLPADPSLKDSLSMGPTENGHSSRKRSKSKATHEERSRIGKLAHLEKVTMDVSPGKKGGIFELPGGARLTVPESQCLKKDVITVALIPPNKRADYCPPLELNDKLASNIYLLHAKPGLRGPVRLQIPCVSKDTATVRAVHRTPEGNWHSADEAVLHESTESPNDVRFSKDTFVITTSSAGAFALLHEPQTETFDVTPNGGLFNAHIHHLISVRIPKRGTNLTASCTLQIIPINEERFVRAQSLFPRETSDVDHLSPFYDFKFPPSEFKRPITVKLPLPPWCEEAGPEATSNELVVMQKVDEQWLPLETPLKFTKNTVSFDTKILTRFCIVRPRKDRKVRVKLSMPKLESSNSIVRGDMLVFALLETKAWHVWAECVPQQNVVEVISERVKKGFTFLKKVPMEPVKQEEEQPSRFYRRNRRRTSIEEQQTKKPEDIEFTNGCTFLFDIDGDLRFKVNPDSDETSERSAIQFHELFDDNYRCMEIEPRPSIMERAETMFLEQVATQRASNGLSNGNANTVGDASREPAISNGDHSLEDRLAGGAQSETDLDKEAAKLLFNATVACKGNDDVVLFNFPLAVDLDDMVDYLGLEAPPEPEPEPEVQPEPAEVIVEIEKPPPVVEEKKVRPRPPNDAFTRLTASNKRPVKITKESKVLTGRSLQVISRAVQQGLTLAVHLNLPDSVITGIGLDSLSNLNCLTDVTYKVLLHWKRTYTSRDRDRMVPDLCTALDAMGLPGMASVIADRNRNNMELTHGCFEY